MVTITDHGDSLQLLEILQAILESLAASGTPGDRIHAFELAQYQRRVCDYYISNLRNQASIYQNSTSTDLAAIKNQIQVFDLVLAKINEITHFWDTSIFIEHPQQELYSPPTTPPGAVPRTPTNSPSSHEPDLEYPPWVRETFLKDDIILAINGKVIESMNQNRSTPLPVQPWQPELQRVIDLQSQINLAKSELSDAVSQRSRTPAHATRELQEKDAEIESLRAKLLTREAQFAQLEAELQNKNIQIAQQAATIRVHSEEISKCHNRPHKYASQPFMLPSQITNLPQGQQSLSQQPHGYGQQYHAQTSYNACGQKTQPPPVLGSGSPGALPTKWGVVNHALPLDPFTSPQNQGRIAANSRGYPMPVGQLKNLTIKEPALPGNGSFTTPPRKQQQAIGVQAGQGDTPSTSGTSDAYSLVPRVPNQSPARTASQASSKSKKKGAVMPTMDAAKEAKVTQSFQALLDEAVSYAYKYVNAPSTQGDNNIPATLKTRLLELATTTTASRIMSNQNTRYFLIAKLILDWIVKEVLCESTFVGYDSKVDQAVRSMREKIWADTPVNVRKVFLQEITKNFAAYANNMEFEQWMTGLSYKRSSDLWYLVKPLVYTHCPGDWVDLYTLVFNAHKIALMMHTDEAEFQFKFHEVNTPFNEAEMINMDPEHRHTPGPTIMAAGGLVRLGALPQILIRLTSAAGKTASKSLVKAGVLIMFPTNR